MQNADLILLVFAFVLAIIAAGGVWYPRWHVGWLALACYFAYLLLSGGSVHFGR